MEEKGEVGNKKFCLFLIVLYWLRDQNPENMTSDLQWLGSNPSTQTWTDMIRLWLWIRDDVLDLTGTFPQRPGLGLNGFLSCDDIIDPTTQEHL